MSKRTTTLGNARVRANRIRRAKSKDIGLEAAYREIASQSDLTVTQVHNLDTHLKSVEFSGSYKSTIVKAAIRARNALFSYDWLPVVSYLTILLKPEHAKANERYRIFFEPLEKIRVQLKKNLDLKPQG